jgi:hypothetical protein
LAQTPFSPGVSIISEMITPALLILACGSLLATVLARLGRVTDNVRKLAEMLEQGGGLDQKNRETLNRMEQRADLAEHSITSYSAAVTLFVLTCLMIGCHRLFGEEFDALSVIAAVLGVVALLVGSGFMLAESRLAVRQVRSDMNDIRAKMKNAE